MSSASKKAKEIAYYYLFHKKLELIYLKGLNHFYRYSYKNRIKSFFGNSDINAIQKFYLIENNFFKNWKSYVNYPTAKKYLDEINTLDYETEEEYTSEVEERCDNMILIGEIKDDSDNKINKPYMVKNNAFDLRNFIHKIIIELEDFDYLIDKKTYNLFSSSYDGIGKNNIEGLVLDKMIAFLIKEERKMKFLFNHNGNMLHLTADFNVDKGYKSSVYLSTDKAIQTYENFNYSILLKKESSYILNIFIEQGILNCEQTSIKSHQGENICNLINNCLNKNKTLNINNSQNEPNNKPNQFHIFSEENNKDNNKTALKISNNNIDSCGYNNNQINYDDNKIKQYLSFFVNFIKSDMYIKAKMNKNNIDSRKLSHNLYLINKQWVNTFFSLFNTTNELNNINTAVLSIINSEDNYIVESIFQILSDNAKQYFTNLDFNFFQGKLNDNYLIKIEEQYINLYSTKLRLYSNFYFLDENFYNFLITSINFDMNSLSMKSDSILINQKIFAFINDNNLYIANLRNDFYSLNI